MSVREEALRSGQVVDAYRIESVLGIGGFGITYKAIDEHLNRYVALKEYFPNGLASRHDDGTTIGPRSADQSEWFEYGRDRFLQEARILATFDQPNIVKVTRYLEAHGTAYLAMNYLEGKPLTRVVQRLGHLSEQQAFALAVHVLRGLITVHGHNYLHRDIKPSNILVRKRKPPVLLDFGSARQSLEARTGGATIVLTPGYAPIEQYYNEEPQGEWSDLYALGATLYYSLLGNPPPPAIWRVASLHENKPDPIATGLTLIEGLISEPFYEVVEWLLRPRAAERPASATEVLERLWPARGEVTRRVSDTASVIGDHSQYRDFTQPPNTTTGSSYLDLTRSPSRGTRTPRRAPPSRAESSRSEPGPRPPAPEAAPAAEPPVDPAPAVARPSEAVLEVVRSRLAAYVGPIAGLLVSRAADSATDGQSLTELLASELATHDERDAFRRGVEADINQQRLH